MPNFRFTIRDEDLKPDGHVPDRPNNLVIVSGDKRSYYDTETKKQSVMEGSCIPALLYVLLAALVCVFLVCKTGFISSIFKAIRRTKSYKKWFAGSLKFWVRQMKDGTTLYKMMDVMFDQIEEKVTEVGGDVLEIGAGTGRSLPYLRLPEGSSLVVVDYNPFMEEHFRESLAKAPHIKLKDYLLQSAADMSNIPDNTLAAAYTIDVMCSLEIENLRKMLREIKRVLKPGGCLFFLEHVLDDPGTWRRTFQKLMTSKLGLWQMIGDGCHCDRETMQYVEEAGFQSVSSSGKLRLHRLQETESGLTVTEEEPMAVYLFNCFIRGCAQK